jgi:hypothetical protein
MDLFVNPRQVELEKNAAEAKLPEDPNQWSGEILQQLFKQVPYVSDFDPKVVMDRVDGERGFGFGHVEIQSRTEAPSSATPESLEAAGVKVVRIPIVIKEGKLLPLDLQVTADSKLLPLTEMRLRQSIFRPQMFDITSKTPGDVSILGQLYPPHRDNYGLGSAGISAGAGGMGKSGSAWLRGARMDIDFGNGHVLKKGEDAHLGDWDHEAGGMYITLPDGRKILFTNYPDDSQKKPATVPAKVRGMGKSGSADAPQNEDVNKAEIVAKVTKKFPELAPKTKISSILSAILPTINEEDYTKFASQFADESLRAAYLANESATSPALRKLASYEGWSAKKVAHGILNSLRPTVMQITKVAGGYKVKSASHNLWVPKEEIVDRGELVKRAGVKLALDADLGGTVTLTEGANVDRDLPSETAPEQIKEFGMWKVQTVDGQELVGYVLPTLMDLDGRPVPVALFTNGTHAALQADMCGVRVGQGASLFEGPARGKGIFYKTLGAGQAAGTIPLTVHAELGGSGGEGLIVETFDGQVHQLVVQPGVKIPTMGGDTAIIPADWAWLPLDQCENVVLVEHAGGMGKQAEATRDLCSVTIRSGGPDSYSVAGMLTDKLGYDQTQFLSFDDAVFLLGGLGVAPSYAQEKLANAYTWKNPVQCRIGRQIETLEDNAKVAAEKTVEALKGYVNLRQNLVKEAAFIPDPNSVDTVLSLGFINPENISVFIESLPVIDEAQEKMCELLLASRLGLQNVPTGALEKAIRATEQVFEGLKLLVFSKDHA